MGEKNTVGSPPKKQLRTFGAVKQIITVALDMEWTVDPGAFQFNWIFPGYFMQASKRVRVFFLIAK